MMRYRKFGGIYKPAITARVGRTALQLCKSQILSRSIVLPRTVLAARCRADEWPVTVLKASRRGAFAEDAPPATVTRTMHEDVLESVRASLIHPA